MTVTDADGTPHEIMVYTMSAPYRDQLLPVSSRYNAVVLQGCLDAGISPQQFYDADEKYRKAYKARAAPCPKETRSRTLTKPAATRSGLFLLQQKENQYEKQTQNKAGIVAAAGGRH